VLQAEFRIPGFTKIRRNNLTNGAHLVSLKINRVQTSFAKLCSSFQVEFRFNHKLKFLTTFKVKTITRARSFNYNSTIFRFYIAVHQKLLETQRSQISFQAIRNKFCSCISIPNVVHKIQALKLPSVKLNTMKASPILLS
jgi:hypothetical protein